MSEEEQGYTFVDKRRPAAGESVPAGPETTDSPKDAPDTETVTALDTQSDDGPEPDDLEPDDDLESDEEPNVYSLLGYCVSLLSTEAWRALGLIANPKTGEAKADLVQAKIAIDAVGDLAARLETAPEDILPPSFRREMQTLLKDLRLNYVAQRDTARP